MTIPIVQGFAVQDSNNNQNSKNDQSYHNADGYTGVSPSRVSGNPSDKEHLRSDPIKKYQDVVWAVCFVLHLVAMSAVIGLGLKNRENGGGSLSVGNVVFVTSATGGTAIVMSACALQFMMNHAETLVQTALVFSIVCSLAIGIVGFMSGSLMMGGIGMLSFAIGCCYAKVVWPRIPFAAANLKTALAAVRVNMGLTAVSFGFTALAFGWTILWFLGVGDALQGGNTAVVFVLFLSYYWVHQVFQNTMHVTTAGVIGTWWWVPVEASSFWSTALTDSLGRATSYSFGSICFGSFLVAVVQALRALERHSRNSDDLQFLSCIIQCILSIIESIVELLNRWAYVYVGLYGFSYLEAGRNVLQLFEAKGWTAVVADDLAENVLFMMSVAIGLASGLVGCVIGFWDADIFSSVGVDNAAGSAFLVGFLAGFLFASIVMSVVGSAVNTVIVCYAEDPAAFQMNHPQLSSEMRSAWVQAWPGLNF